MLETTLIRIHHQNGIRTDCFSHDLKPLLVALEPHSHFDLEGLKPLGHGFLAQTLDLFVRVTCPGAASRVGWEPILSDELLSLLDLTLLLSENLDCFLPCQRVFEISEVQK